MRHGIPWWEAFWKWMVKEVPRPSWAIIDDDGFEKWFKDRHKEFSEKWRTEEITVPPKGR